MGEEERINANISQNICWFQFFFVFLRCNLNDSVMTTITREHLEDEVLKSIQKKAESIMPKDAKVILFGSRARRDAKADSDWDILVLLNKDKIDEQDHDNYTYPLWELGWQINQMIHPIVYSMKDWQSKKGSPFYNNVEEEGVMLC